MPEPFRLIDGGLADGRRQVAQDAALVELHAAGRLPDTVRFLRCPPTVIVGRHQPLRREVDIARCRAEGVALARRLTGGRAIYVDERQLAWEVAFARQRIPGPLDAVARALCEAIAAGLSQAFGVAARYRARNDIEVEGRKLCVGSGCFRGDTVFYQGVLNVDLDPERVLPCLNLPGARARVECCAAAAERMTSLRALLGTAPALEAVQAAMLEGLRTRLDIETAPAEPTAEERALAARRFREEIGGDAFVFGADAGAAPQRTAESGPVRVDLRLEGARIREALFTGDFRETPPRVVFDLEARLRDVPATQAPAVTEAFLSGARAMLALPIAQFREAVEAALAPELAR